MRKILTLATVALLGSTGLALAQETLATENAFGLPEVQSDNLLIVLPLVTATADGVVEIRPVVSDRASEVLGSQPVTAGANENVRINLTQAPLGDKVMAVLVVGGQDVAMQEVPLSSVGGADSNRGGGEGGDNGGGDNGGGNDNNGG